MIISQRFKHSFWSAITFTVLIASSGNLLLSFVVFVGSFILWWFLFKTDKRQIGHAVWVGFSIAVIISVLGIFDDFQDIMANIMITLFTSLLFSLVSIPVSIAIHIFQTKSIDKKNTLSRQIIKAIILIVGISILLFKIDGKQVTTSTSPSKKIILQINKSCCLICPDIRITLNINNKLHKNYSEICTIRANTSFPTKSSKFSWNNNETIVRWKSSDNNSTGEIDLNKDCGSPVLPSSLDDGDPQKFVFTSPSQNKILFRKKTCLRSPCKKISTLRVWQSEDQKWRNYYCDFKIPNGTQSHGGSMRTEDIPDDVAIAPIIKWKENETFIYSPYQSFSFDLREACNWKKIEE